MGKFEPIIDRILGFTISKKLTAFIIACVFAYFDKITGAEWKEITFYYIITQGGVDGLKELKNFLEIYKNRNNE